MLLVFTLTDTLGSQINGIKYANACRVFTKLNVQKDPSLYHFESGCLREVSRVRHSGLGGRVIGKINSRIPRTMKDRIRSATGIPNLSMSGAKAIGSTRPPTDVPAKMIPFAVPLLLTNQAAMNERQGA